MQFLSIAEIIAALDQPGSPDVLPRRRPTLKKWLEAAKVISRIRYGGNYTTEYALGGLPAEFQTFLGAPSPPESWEPLNLLDAKIEVLGAFDKFRKESGLLLWQAAQQFEQLFNQGIVCAEGSIRTTIQKISDSSIVRWFNKLRSNGETALQGQYYWQRRRAVEKDPEILEVCRGSIASSPRTIYRILQSEFPDKKLPSEASIYRWREALRKQDPTLFVSQTNPTQFRNSLQLALGNASEQIDRVNQRWEIDGTRADVLEIGGKRYTLLLAIEVFSRRALISVVEANTADNVVNLHLRKCFQTWGIPEEIRIDCGREYLNKRLQAMCLGMGINLKACIPGKPEQKPHVERMFRTLREGLLQALPGYVGYNPMLRKMLESANGGAIKGILTSQDLQDVIDGWLANNYEQRHHKGIGNIPLQQWLASPVKPKYITDDRQLDVLLLPTGTARVGKEGIYFKGTYYLDRTGKWEAHRGKRLAVRIDESKAQIYCFTDTPNSEFLFIAVDPQMAGLANVDLIAAAKKEEKARLGAVKKIFRRARRKVDELRKKKTTQPASDPNPKVVPFQRAESAPVNAEIEAVVREIDRLIDPIPAAQPLGAEAAATKFTMQQPVEAAPISAMDRYRQLRHRDRSTLSADDHAFMARYESVLKQNQK
jgi:putative transposase